MENHHQIQSTEEQEVTTPAEMLLFCRNISDSYIRDEQKMDLWPQKTRSALKLSFEMRRHFDCYSHDY